MVTAISAPFLSAVISGSIFATRRLNKGFDNMQDKPLYGCMNFGIAAAQGLKTFKALDGFAGASKAEPTAWLNNVKRGYENLAATNKAVSISGKALNIAADYVNPLIILAGGIKVLTSDDKADAFTREALALGTMFGSEALAKNIFGMTSASRNILTGAVKPHVRVPLHKKMSPAVTNFVDKYLTKFCDYCGKTKVFNKISLAPLPHVLKGLAFVTFSILGYKIGESIANKIIGKKADNKKAA